MSTEWTTDEEAAALHKRFDDLKRVGGGGQADFARKWGIRGGASMVSQHIKARRPISIDAAIAYAAGFGCTVSDISPRLAKTIERAASITPPAQLQDALSNQPVVKVERAQAAINDVATLGQTLASLADHLKAMDIDTRRKAMLLISDLAADPDSHATITAMIDLSIRSKRQKAA